MNTTYETILVKTEAPFAYIRLNRPEARNAMNQQMVADLRAAFAALREDDQIRGVVIAGTGSVFCAGGDIKEMRAAASDPDYVSTAHTANFDDLLEAIINAPQVVIARVEGAAMGGGLGLVCAADIALASENARFGLPEVRLGLVPALISPYVIARIGQANTRRLMLTGARLEAHDALHYGLVNEVADEMDAQVDRILDDLRECAPGALAACKRLITHIAGNDFSATAQFRADLLDERRSSAEGQEGTLAFIQKRKPQWAQSDDEKSVQ